MKKSRIIIAVLCLVLILTACGQEYATSYSIGTGPHQVFAVAGDELLAADTMHVRCYDLMGSAVVEEAVNMGLPAVSSNENSAVAYDIGGTECVFSDGRRLTAGETIISAFLGESGSFALCTEEDGYRGSVTVFDTELNECFKWYCADASVTRAALTADGEALAVLCTGDDGSAVHIFSVTGGTELGLCDVGTTYISDIEWLGDTLCAISENGLFFMNGRGQIGAEYSFGKETLGSYVLCDDCIVCEVCEFLSGGAGSIVAISDKGEERGRAETGAMVSCFDSLEDEVLAICGNKIILFDKNMKIKKEFNASGAEKAFLRQLGDVLICKGAQAESLR